MKEFDLIIIGAGPAGLSAGIYAARGGLNTVIVEKSSIGGLASTASSIENYPGIKAASGFDICYAMYSQCEELGVNFTFDCVESLELEGATKCVRLGSGDCIYAKQLILTVGASPKKLGLEGEDRLTGKGISYCATCDGALFKGKTVAVIGGGNTAAADALYLEKLAAKAYLIHRRDTLRADKILADRLQNSNVEIIWDSVVTKLYGDDKLTQIDVENVKNGTLSALTVDCVFVAIGQSPNTNLAAGLSKDSYGYIITDEDMRTSISGVYAAGDVRSKSLRQIVTACADGAIAADTAIKALL